jgi:hypothetical protein
MATKRLRLGFDFWLTAAQQLDKPYDEMLAQVLPDTVGKIDPQRCLVVQDLTQSKGNRQIAYSLLREV